MVLHDFIEYTHANWSAVEVSAAVPVVVIVAAATVVNEPAAGVVEPMAGGLAKFCSVATSVVAVPTAALVILNPPMPRFAVGTACPSMHKLCVSAVARSLVSVLNVDELMVVPLTTGWPAGSE